MTDFDVAIVGAGPAGSSAAIALASAGHSVALLEKESFPRRKVCGEFLSASGRRRLEAWGLGQELEAIGGERISRGGFFLSDGRSRGFGLPEPGLGISRFRLDDLLARRACAAGAELLPRHEVRSVEGDFRDGFRLAARRPDGERRLFARLALSAWGRWSPLDIAFDREFASRREGRFFGWCRHYRGDSRHLAGRVHLYFFPGGYCGLSRVEGGEVNFAGIVAEAALREHGGGWKGFTARLRNAHGPLAEHLEPLDSGDEILGSSTVFFEPHSPDFRGMLAIGDAAGVRDPFTGDGLATAIAGGALVARLAGEFLAGRLAPGELAANYRSEWRRRFGPRFYWDSLLRRLMLSERLQRVVLPLAGPLVSMGFRATRS